MKKVLVIGFGSIGKRHVAAYKDEGAQVALVTAQSILDSETFTNTTDALAIFKPDIVVIANQTDKHETALKELVSLDYRGVVVAEKPLASHSFELNHHFSALVVAYNLRMSPILQTLKKELVDKKLVSAIVYCGQYLPDWRPNRDYRNIYSSKKEMGGGVLRDLSHELDYSQWLFGRIKNVAAMGGHFSELEIDSDDVFSILGESVECPVINISINYLDRVVKRTILVHTTNETYHADMILGKLCKNSEVLLENIKTVSTYAQQARHVLNDDFEFFCDFSDATNTLNLIKAAEDSVIQKRFITI